MLLRSQSKDVHKKTGSKFTALHVAVVVALGTALIAFDASAATDKIDMLTTGMTALPAETLKVYSGLLKIVPFGAGAAALLAAMRGGMGYVMGLVRTVIS